MKFNFLNKNLKFATLTFSGGGELAFFLVRSSLNDVATFVLLRYSALLLDRCCMLEPPVKIDEIC